MAKATTPKKSTTKIKKAVGKKSELGIKYQDKSAGQPQLPPIFEAIQKLMMPYVKGTIKLRGGTGGELSLVSEKEVVIEGRKKKEVWFAGLLIQKGYVGFYFMPVYAAPEIKTVFQPELLKCLKGKSCFHIKKDDPVIMKQIKEALKIGYGMYVERGWA